MSSMSWVAAEDIIKFILTTDNPKDLELVQSVLNLRRKTDRDAKEIENLHSLYVGDRVILSNIRPVFLSGMKGTIQNVKDDNFVIYLDDWPKSGSRERTVPASCLTKIS